MVLNNCRFLLITCSIILSGGCSDTVPPFNSEIRSSGFSIKGISVVAPYNPIEDRVLQPILDVHANSISLMPYSFCSAQNPIVVYNHKEQWWGEKDEGVIECIKKAQKKKLSVMLKPHLWIRGMYTGTFSLPGENEWKLWETSYRLFILHYATIADSLHVELFCIGTELGKTIKERPSFWSSLIDTIKQTYHGKLTYAANWDDYKDFPYWEKLDYIGVDAYFPLAKLETPDINSLIKSWQKYRDDLQRVSSIHHRQVIFTEYGYRNVDYNTSEPWKEDKGNQNNKAQANALEAFYQSFSGRKWFAGGFVWKWYLDNAFHQGAKIDYTPQDKPAAKIIENWYTPQ